MPYTSYYPTYFPTQRTEPPMGQMYTPQPTIAPVQSVGQTQGISPASRPVSSKEEAMAVGADFSGAPMIFPDMAHNAVYVKRWDYGTGSAVFVEYVPKDSEVEAPAAIYATQGDFKELAERLTERLDDIEADIERLKKKGAKKNADE